MIEDRVIRGSLYTLPAYKPFAEVLARGVCLDYADSLSEASIFLPSQRACKSLEAMFLSCAEGEALILPRLIPLGAVEQVEEEWESEEGEGEEREEEDSQFKEKISNLERRLLLLALIERWQSLQRGKKEQGEVLPSPFLADALARLNDEMVFDEVAPSALLAEGLVPDDCAEHWRDSLDFLKILTEHWPNILQERGLSDASRLRIAALDRAARSVESAPGGVVVAGSTGSVRATARLMEATLRLERGQVILPGCPLSFRNLEGDTTYKESLHSPSHPFHAFAQFFAERPLLAPLLRPYPLSSAPEAAEHIRKFTFLQSSMSPRPHPPQISGELGLDLSAPITRLDCRDGGEEAEIVALLMRETLDTPNRRANLITRDRMLARRVRSVLFRRWGIVIEDTAERSLSESQAGKLFLGLLQALVPSSASSTRASAFPLDIAALQGAFYALAPPLSPAAQAFARFEARTLRNPSRDKKVGRRETLQAAQDLAKLQERLEAEKNAEKTTLGEKDFALLQGALQALLPFAARLREGGDRLTLLEAHIAAAEAFAHKLYPREGAEAEEEGEEEEGEGNPLYQTREGGHLRNFCNKVREHWSEEQPPRSASYAYKLLMEGLVRAESLPGLHPSHPRLSILGPLEARLLSSDRLILGGMNEGKWPPQCDGGPFLPRETRKKLGLRAAETRVGLSALDFLNFGASARELYLTRAEREQGQPQMPSRFLQRLQALGDFGNSERLKELRFWAESLAEGAEGAAPSPAPAPRAPRACPPLSMRPTRINLTSLETLLLDPYGFYALYVLKLRSLESLRIEGEELLRGQFLHKVFEDLPELFAENEGFVALEKALVARSESLVGEYAPLPSMAEYWRLEFAHNARHLARRLLALKPLRMWSERRGEAHFTMPSSGRTIVIRARADLIVEGEEQWYVIDHKSGAIPSGKEIRTFVAPQLLFEGWMLQHGKFEDLPALPQAPIGLYWAFKGRQNEGETQRIDEAFVAKNKKHLPEDCSNLQELYEACTKFYQQLLESYENEEKFYQALPLPAQRERFDPYRHLARRQEWGEEDSAEPQELES